MNNSDIPCPGIDKRDIDMVEKGLTARFRDTPAYKKMVSDILHLSPNATRYEIDTTIW
jgi:hypothetical protein